MWLADVLLGAVAPGVNQPTFWLLNCILGLVVCSLLLLLGISIWAQPALTPHVVALLTLALALWCAIVWLVSTIGCVDAQQQQEQLLNKPGGDRGKAEEGGPRTLERSASGLDARKES